MRTQANTASRQASLIGMGAASSVPGSVQLKATRGAARFAPLADVPGKVNIGRWTSPTDHADIMEYMRLFGYVGAVDFKRRCSERTFSIRKQTLLSTFRMVRERNRGIKTLAQFTPRLIPMILDYWGEEVAVGKMRHALRAAAWPRATSLGPAMVWTSTSRSRRLAPSIPSSRA